MFCEYWHLSFLCWKLHFELWTCFLRIESVELIIYCWSLDLFWIKCANVDFLQAFHHLVDCTGIWSKIVIFRWKLLPGHCDGNFLAVNFSASRIADVLPKAPPRNSNYHQGGDDDDDGEEWRLFFSNTILLIITSISVDDEEDISGCSRDSEELSCKLQFFLLQGWQG